MNTEQITEVVRLCNYPDYSLRVITDSRGAIYLQGSYLEEDTITQKMDTQVTRRWFLSPAMTKSEIVQTVFKLVMTSAEHRVREHFKYRGKPVFSPHFAVDALWEVCESGGFAHRETL